MRLPMLGRVLIAGTSIVLATAHADDKDAIAYREHVMETLNAQTAIIGQILSLAIPDDNAVAHLEAIALSASTVKTAFEAKAPGGKAKAAVWENWPDFSKRVDEFAKNTAAVAKVGREQGKEAALQIAFDALDCKGCHDVYREDPKKKPAR